MKWGMTFLWCYLENFRASHKGTSQIDRSGVLQGIFPSPSNWYLGTSMLFNCYKDFHRIFGNKVQIIRSTFHSQALQICHGINESDNTKSSSNKELRKFGAGESVNV